MNAEVMVITPERAQQLLETNTRNRPLSKRRVQHLAEAIKRGEWELNGQTIVLNGSRLLDGQHRLSACVEANMPITTFVISGVDDKSFHTIDTGTPRTVVDLFAMSNVPNSRCVAAALKWVNQYETRSVALKTAYTIPQMEELLERYPGIVPSASRCKNTRIITPSLLTASHYLFKQLDFEAAEKFVTDLNTGVELAADDGVFVLRERLLNDNLSKGKLSAAYKFALVIKAWNARRDGISLKALRWREAGPAAEPFPVIK